MVWPPAAAKWGTSILAIGSSARISTRSPGLSASKALRSRNVGTGQRWPLASIVSMARL
jgi:hypothetical protein